jgi:SagB-type dehydrogenase family enzyme
MKRTSILTRGTIGRLRLLPGIALAVSLLAPCAAQSQSPESILLNPPDKTRGLPFMQTLSVKASAREYSDRELSLQDLSDLLWAANGLNRPEEKKYTASSAMNAHDIDIYVFMKGGVYLYDADRQLLSRVLEGDQRSLIAMQRPDRPADPSNPPVQLVLVSCTARFRAGTKDLKFEWGAIDAGIVSQNISLFCAATGLRTRPKASMDREKIRALLKLDDTQYVLLNHPVGYAK